MLSVGPCGSHYTELPFGAVDFIDVAESLNQQRIRKLEAPWACLTCRQQQWVIAVMAGALPLVTKSIFSSLEMAGKVARRRSSGEGSMAGVLLLRGSQEPWGEPPLSWASHVWACQRAWELPLSKHPLSRHSKSWLSFWMDGEILQWY